MLSHLNFNVHFVLQLSMTNNQEKAIMEGVRANAYSQSEATQLLHKDTVQIHAARWYCPPQIEKLHGFIWVLYILDCTAPTTLPFVTCLIHRACRFSLGTECLGVVENMDLVIWPRVDLERMEILCFSRWKSEEGVPEEQKDPYRLMTMRFACVLQHPVHPMYTSCYQYALHTWCRFVMWQDVEISRNIIPYLAKVVRAKDKKGGIIFNTPQVQYWSSKTSSQERTAVCLKTKLQLLFFVWYRTWDCGLSMMRRENLGG